MSPTATTALSAEQRRQFERDGYFFPVPVLEPAEVEAYLARYHDYVARNRERLDALPANRKYRVLSQTHFVLRWVHAMVTNPRILDAVESVLGPNLLAWDTNWFTKMPGDRSYITWHQDGTYWNLRPPSVVTAWVALSPVWSENGCMRVIPGTHTTPFLPQRETHVPDNALSRGQEIAVEVDEARAVDLVLQPGEASLHHIWTVHGSNANVSRTPRIGIAIRYVRPEVVQESPGKPMAVLVRGRDDCGNFELQSPPDSDAHDAAAHGAIIDRIRSSVMLDQRAAG